MPTIQERITKPSGSVGKIAACIYGRGGVGKTTLLATLPGRGLVLDTTLTEGGTMVLTHVADRIDVLQVNEWNDFEAAMTYLKNIDTYGWCAIDSLSGAQEYAKVKTVHDRPLDTDPSILTLQEYGKIGELMRSLILRVRALGLHVVCTAQERNRDGELQPDLTPASLSALIPPMYLIGRLYTSEVDHEGQITIERRLRVGPHASYATKVRAVPGRAVPAIIRNPNLGLLFGYLLGAANVPPPEEVQVSVSFLGEAS